MNSVETIRAGVLSLLIGMGLSMVAGAAPGTPLNCVAAGVGFSSGGASIGISWTDNSTDETSWRVEISTNNGVSFGWMTDVISSTSGATGAIWRLPWTGGVANYSYRFRVYAFNGAQFSAASNEASVTTAPFVVTTALVPNQVAVNLSWPLVQNASGYEIWGAFAGSSNYGYLRTVAGGVGNTQIAAPILAGANTYSFQVRPIFVGSLLGIFTTANVALNVITSKTGTSGNAGSAFSHTFTQSTVAPVSSRFLTYNGQAGLPTGLVFNANTGLLSGVYPAQGNYTFVYTAVLSNGSSLSQSFSIRVRPPAGPPLIGSVIPSWVGMAGSSRDTDLTGAFLDPEAESAVRVSTSLGNMDFILFDSATPATVANFMNYVAAGKYTDVAFHRSIAGFVIQGGGFKGTGSNSDFSSVVTNPPVQNEPGIGNVRGTISMAKSAGNADSATSQFFVSLGDNRSNLDYQNGGFTVFGRVAGNGMAVADAISNLPTQTYNLFIDGRADFDTFEGFPMNAATAPVTMDQTKLVKTNSITSIPTLQYSITGNTNPSVATASVVGGQLRLVGLAGGHTTITVTATDLDNLTNTQTVEVTIEDSFSSWASGISFPGGQNGVSQDPDGDGLTNLEEYAFFGDPAVSSRDPLPIAGEAGVAPDPRFLALTFPVRKFSTGLSYVVEGSASPAGAWTAVWSDSDGFESPRVSAAVDQADRTVVTIKDNVPIGGQPMRFLRTRIVQD